MPKQTKYYRVNESEHFNLQSMHDHLICLRYSAEDTGNWEEYDRLTERIEEVEDLLDAAPCIGCSVTWPQLRRIREIRDERNLIRYQRSLTAGASEQEAGNAFM